MRKLRGYFNSNRVIERNLDENETIVLGRVGNSEMRKRVRNEEDARNVMSLIAGSPVLRVEFIDA